MEIVELKKAPHELYQGRIIIQVKEGKSTVCRVRRIYPEVDVEVAVNSGTLTKGASAGKSINLPFSQYTPDGYYECPLVLVEQAQFPTVFSMRDLFLLWVADWQTYAQQGYCVVKYSVFADGGMVDFTTDDPEEALDLYQKTLGVAHILRLYVHLSMEGDVEPREEVELFLIL